MGKKDNMKLIILVAILLVVGYLFYAGLLSIAGFYMQPVAYSQTPTKTTFTTTESPSFTIQNEEWTHSCSSCNGLGYYMAAQITQVTVDGVVIANPDSSAHCYYYTMTNNVPKILSKGTLNFILSIPARTTGNHTISTKVKGGFLPKTTADSTCQSLITDYGQTITLTDTFAVGTTSPPIPPTIPSIGDFWNSIKTWIDGVITWLRNLLPFTIATATTPVNVPYSTTISLSGIPATDTDYSDGSVSETTCAGFIIDFAGAYKYQGTPIALASGVTTYSTTVTFTPTVAGKYAQGIACVSRYATYNYATQQWSSWTSPTVTASDKGDITVTGPSAPGEAPPVDFWGSISAFINGIFCWLRQLLGQGTC